MIKSAQYDSISGFEENKSIKTFLNKTTATINITINGTKKSFSTSLTLKQLFAEVTKQYADFIMYLDLASKRIIIGTLKSNINTITVSDDLGLFTKLAFSSTVEAGKALAPNTNHIWVDDEEWNDTKYWVETPAFTKRYKITMQPKYAQLTEVI
jgi:hypothetical protein